jgi:hypothetical protein
MECPVLFGQDGGNAGTFDALVGLMGRLHNT